jgi:hypothetical protein
MTGNRSYDNPASAAERLAVHRNDERVRKGGTYFEFAASESGAIGGRFAAREKSTVIGSGPVAYPRQPVDSPWASEPVGQERPSGFSVEEMLPAGEPHEVATSLLGEASDAAGRLLPAAAGQASPGEEQRSDAGSPFTVSSEVAPSSPPSKRKRRSHASTRHVSN